MMSGKGFRVTVEDLDTGVRRVMKVAEGDYVLIPFAPCYRHHVQTYPMAGTHVITIKGYRPARPGQVVDVPDEPAAMLDVVFPDGSHDYWSTHCRHGNHEACSATELVPGVPRRPAQCKTCGSPCACTQCDHVSQEVSDVT